MTTTDRDIAILRRNADAAGDLDQSALCVLALGGRDAIRGAARGTEMARLFTSRRSQASARAECDRVILSGRG